MLYEHASSVKFFAIKIFKINLLNLFNQKEWNTFFSNYFKKITFSSIIRSNPFLFEGYDVFFPSNFFITL